MLTFYENHGYKLFPCKQNKEPMISGWNKSEDHPDHINTEKAAEIMDNGGYVGAWLPPNHVVIDIDMNHTDRKTGAKKPDGMGPFLALCDSLGIERNLMESTRVVKTGSGGYHLYFYLPDGIDYRDLSQKGLAQSVDVRTHAGYVIAAGTERYAIHNEADIAQLPAPIVEMMRRKAKEKAGTVKPTKELPPEVLQKVLNKIDVKNFSNNDSWQEFITSCIATAGNSDEVIDILEAWSKSDDSYADDDSVRTRIESFEPSGGITAGTFLHLIKPELSKYLYSKIRMLIGAEFDYSKDFADKFEVPVFVDYSRVHEHIELMKSFYYKKNQSSAVELFALLVKDELYYVENEKRFYYFNGNVWVEMTGIQRVIFTVLLHAGIVYYADYSDSKDDDAKEYINEYIGYTGALSFLQKVESALKQNEHIRKKSVLWDGPNLEATLTLEDCVMDFSGEGVVFRKGRKEENRRLTIDLKMRDFENKDLPHKFRQFLKDVFPNDDTRKMATYALSTMLSGTGKFRKFQIWNGAGNNGKSALMQIMQHIIGERAVTYTPNVLLASGQHNSLTPELAVLRGALVAFSSETDEAKKVSEGAVKNLTGNETITANPKYQSQIQFETTFQLVLSTNYLPTFSAHDGAFINRLLILPFYTTFYNNEEQRLLGERRGSKYFKPARDGGEVEREILEERAQVLYYLAKRYQELGHTIPESEESTAAKNHYIKDNNGVMDMILEMLEFDEEKNWFTPTSDIVNYYNSDQNTRYSSRFIVSRIKEVYPLVDNHTKRIHGKLTRGLRNVRLKIGAYPEGYDGNYTHEEKQEFSQEDY